MKRINRYIKLIVVSLICLAILTGCEMEDNTENLLGDTTVENSVQSEAITNDESIVLDYENETDFENDLNNGTNVEGKIVQFRVKRYEPDSLLGCNAQSGEHLNFISEEYFDLNEGTIVVGRVKSNYKLFGSHIINYEKLSIDGSSVEDNTNKINPPMNYSDATGHNYKEIEYLFKKTGFSNVIMKDVGQGILNPNYIVKNVSINGYSYYKDIEYYPKDAEVIIEYTFPYESEEISINNIGKQYEVSQFNKDDYDEVYYKMVGQYRIYYLFDEDNKKVISFGVDFGIRSGTYTGTIEEGISINWNNETETFKKVKEKETYHDKDQNGEFINTREVTKYYIEGPSGKYECQEMYSIDDYLIRILNSI